MRASGHQPRYVLDLTCLYLHPSFMILAHRIQLRPSKMQANYFARAAGTARFAWNWALEEWQRQYAAGEKPSAPAISRAWTGLKTILPWTEETDSNSAFRAIRDLGTAFSRFFAKKAKYPRFKRKGEHDSFYVHNKYLVTAGKQVKLPKVGWVRLAEELRFHGKIMGARVTRQADRWFISIQVDVGEDYRREPAATRSSVVGVDLGVKELAVLSTGECVRGPKALKSNLKRLRHLSKSHSRKQKGSKNRVKARMKLARLHARISNVRKDALHKLTTKLCRENQAVVVEDLNVRGMVANRRLARAISDMGFGEFRRQLDYKSKLHGTEIVVADRFYPSSKTCSGCGVVREKLLLSEREWACAACGEVHDRDLNAAKNLEKLGRRPPDVMPVEMKALASRKGGETVVSEAGTCPSVLTGLG